MKLYLIRHAESANNAIFSGTGAEDGRVPDPEITDTGHRQAAVLARHLADPAADSRHHPATVSQQRAPGFGLTHLYCSLMTRSILTGRYIAEVCGLSLYAHADLFERGGIYELDPGGQKVGRPGPDRTYFDQRFPEVNLPDSLGDGGWYDRPAETDDMFFERIRRARDDILDRHLDSHDCVAVVVHGDFIDQFVNELTGVARHPANYERQWEANWAVHNTSLTRIDFVAGARTVVYTNRLDHLPTELVTW